MKKLTQLNPSIHPIITHFNGLKQLSEFAQHVDPSRAYLVSKPFRICLEANQDGVLGRTSLTLLQLEGGGNS